MKNIHPDYLGETARRIKLKNYPDARQFVVQHLYQDTLRLLLLLHEHVKIDCVIGIGYSGNPDVVQTLRETGIQVLTPSYEDLAQVVEEELGLSLARCKKESKQLVIHEVGGYAIKSLHESHTDSINLVAGAIEVTKQGVWVAQSLPELKIPQLNCAETRLKQIEGKMVGESVVSALDNILREMGIAITGRAALLSGYGWVGKGAAEGLKHRGVQVTVRDTDVIKNVSAAVDGYIINRTSDDLYPPALVVGTSGHQSITSELIDQLPNRCFLVSGSSKDHEIDLAYLNSITRTSTQIHEHVEALELLDDRTLFLVNKGYPVNFTGSSVPDEIVEFLFAELIMLVPELLDKKPAPGTYPLPVELENIAARVWLDLR